LVDDGPKLIAPVLFLDQSYPEKLFSISFEEISRNPILHQIQPIYESYNMSHNMNQMNCVCLEPLLIDWTKAAFKTQPVDLLDWFFY